jgi:hypothetical protein
MPRLGFSWTKITNKDVGNAVKLFLDNPTGFEIISYRCILLLAVKKVNSLPLPQYRINPLMCVASLIESSVYRLHTYMAIY